MSDLPNFRLTSLGKLTQKLLEQGIANFHEAICLMNTLPYGRTSNYRNLELLISEGRGTYSSKHAFLVQLAREHQLHAFSLSMCSFNMCPENTSPVGSILRRHGISCIPEVSCLLKYEDTLYDVTTESQRHRADIVSDIEIAPQQIANFKKRYHLNYIENWLQIEKVRHFSVTDIWQIREECIHALQQTSPRAQLCCA